MRYKVQGFLEYTVKVYVEVEIEATDPDSAAEIVGNENIPLAGSHRRTAIDMSYSDVVVEPTEDNYLPFV